MTTPQPTTDGASSWWKRLTPLGIGLVVLVGSAALVENPPAGWEERIFRSINDLPRGAENLLWAIQQMGSALVLPVAALGLWWITRRWQPPVAILATGFLIGWLAAKGIKAIVGRGRPAAILEDVYLGYDVPIDEVGFPSGHAVLAFTLAVVFWQYLSKRGRIIAFGLAILVALIRIHVGAHLPLDVIGGAGYGIAIGTLVTVMSAPRLPVPSDGPGTPDTDT